MFFRSSTKQNILQNRGRTAIFWSRDPGRDRDTVLGARRRKALLVERFRHGIVATLEAPLRRVVGDADVRHSGSSSAGKPGARRSVPTASSSSPILYGTASVTASRCLMRTICRSGLVFTQTTMSTPSPPSTHPVLHPELTAWVLPHEAALRALPGLLEQTRLRLVVHRVHAPQQPRHGLRVLREQARVLHEARDRPRRLQVLEHEAVAQRGVVAGEAGGREVAGRLRLLHGLGGVVAAGDGEVHAANRHEGVQTQAGGVAGDHVAVAGDTAGLSLNALVYTSPS